ncbi:MAG: hypothetical protein K2X66_15545 [Cyanobacteria bacterium]|nr:hypothetical protein [Cyanobacteriota bacterium]
MQVRFQGLYHFSQLNRGAMAKDLVNHFNANGIETKERTITSVVNSHKYHAGCTYGDAYHPHYDGDGIGPLLTGVTVGSLVVATGKDLGGQHTENANEASVYQTWLTQNKAKQWPTEVPPSQYGTGPSFSCR